MDCVNGRLNLGSALLLTHLLRKEIYHAAKVRWWSFSYSLLWGKTAEELHMAVAIKCSNKLFSHLKCTASMSFWLTTPLPHWRRIGNSFMICLWMWCVWTDDRQSGILFYCHWGSLTCGALPKPQQPFIHSLITAAVIMRLSVCFWSVCYSHLCVSSLP